MVQGVSARKGYVRGVCVEGGGGARARVRVVARTEFFRAAAEWKYVAGKITARTKSSLARWDIYRARWDDEDGRWTSNEERQDALGPRREGLPAHASSAVGAVRDAGL